MAEPIKLRVEGARQLRRTLKDAGDDLSDLKAAHREAAEIAAAGAKGLAPVGPTGRTKGSIRASGTKTTGIIRAGRKALPYVGRVHYGDPSSFKAKIRRAWSRLTTPRGGGRIQPNTYLTDGAKATEPVWVNRYMDLTNEAIQKVEGI